MNRATGRKVLAMAGVAATLCLVLRLSQAQSDESKERKEYADEIRESYNFRFGNDKLSTPATLPSKVTILYSRELFPRRRIALTATSRRTANGVKPCTRTRSERRSTAPA